MASGEILIIGGGLAGVEAAWQASLAGARAIVHEMKPQRFSPAHRSPNLAELVCSNSLRSLSMENASGLLKEEMRRLGSLVLSVADETSVPAGSCLAVDREAFSREITRRLEGAGVSVVRREVIKIPEPPRTLMICTGPLTSDALAREIQTLTGADALQFYDAIAPIVDSHSIDYAKVFWASRYDKGGDDYLNCPMDQESYNRFREELLAAQKVPLREFEEVPPFEGCMPVEDLAARGEKTLAYGPMRPVGLADPGTGKRPYAVVQLRRDNRSATLLNMVGFQTKMTRPEQKRVFRLIPGLENAEFYRYGSLHRNTFLNAPLLLSRALQLKRDPRIFFAGQLTGVEGYIASAATGMIAGKNAVRWTQGKSLRLPPPTTSLGALLDYVTEADPKTFQPMHVNFGIFPPLGEGRMPSRKRRREAIVQRALHDLDPWCSQEEA
jgi:methylenetetrahydrofolate--tRNA-(uracil-5-)-methyltransferase